MPETTDLRKAHSREGTRGMMRSRFAAVRVRVAHRDYWRKEPHPEQWLLIEWPAGEKEPTKYWLSNLNASTILRKLVGIAKLRLRIERDYDAPKYELPGDFEVGLARISSSCNSVDCSLRLPGFGAVPFPPLSQLTACRSRKHPS